MEEKSGIEHIWRQGNKLLDGFREMTEQLGIENARLEGIGPMSFFGFRGGDERMGKFIHTFIEKRWITDYICQNHIYGLSRCRIQMRILHAHWRFQKPQ